MRPGPRIRPSGGALPSIGGGRGAGRLLTLTLAVVVVGSTLVTGPAGAQDDDDDRTVPIERRTVALVRRIEPYDGALVTRDGDGVVVSLDGDVLFDFDSASLTDQARATLTDLAATIDDDLTGDTVTVTGHTDSSGEDAYNLDLSSRRAEAVRDFLQDGVTVPVRFVVEGKGETEPVATERNPDGSEDPEAMRRNRRVEVSFPVDPGTG